MDTSGNGKSPASTLGTELRRSIFASMAGRYMVYVAQAISLLVLSRLFGPADFGIVATAQALTLFFQLLASSGVAPAIVYLEDVPARDRNGIFSFTALVGTLLAGTYLAAVVIYSGLVRDIPAVGTASVLAVNVLLSALSVVPAAALQRDRKFWMIAVSDTLAEIVALLVCLIVALYFGGVAALMTKLAVSAVGRFLGYFTFSGRTEIGRPRFGANLLAVSRIYKFSKYQIGFNIFNYASRNLDTLIVASSFGFQAVGLYDRVYQVMRYPLQLFAYALTPALQPTLTKHRHADPATVLAAYQRIAGRMAVVGGVAGTAICWCAADVLFLLLGAPWTQAAPLLQVFAVSIGVQMVLSSTGGVFQAFGKPDLQFWCGVFSSVCAVTAMLGGVMLGHSTLAVAQFLVVAYAINCIQAFAVLRRVFPGTGIGSWIALFLLSTWPYGNLILPLPGTQSGLTQSLLHLCIAGVAALATLSVYRWLLEPRLFGRSP